MEYKPGRELDALVAEKVMSWKFEHDFYLCENPRFKRCSHCMGVTSEGNPLNPKCPYFPYYSADIAAAWEVVDKFKAFEPEISWSDEQHCWHALFWKGKSSGQSSAGLTVPHAICLAALKAVGAI